MSAVHYADDTSGVISTLPEGTILTTSTGQKRVPGMIEVTAREQTYCVFEEDLRLRSTPVDEED